MACSLINKIKIAILFSSIVICIVLLFQGYSENIGAEWQKYQKLYKAELVKLASTDTERALAKDYKIKMRQIVLPELNRFDRCVTCHVGIENPQMINNKQPLKFHSGKFLADHNLEKIGCTICHSGQGRAITFAESKAHGHQFFWEDPLLPLQFIEANCMKCHRVDDFKEDSIAKKGKELFVNNGCMGCHSLNGQGQNLGLDLSKLGKESFHVKYPKGKNKESYLRKFQHNKNIAYIYESIADPDAEGQNTLMRKFNLTDEDIIALTVYLKGSTHYDIPNSLRPTSFFKEKAKENLSGKQLYLKYCSACHGKDAAGGIKNRNTKEGAVPALIRVKESFTVKELKKAISGGKTTLKNDPSGLTPMNMPAWKDIIDEEDITKISTYLFSLMPEEDDDW